MRRLAERLVSLQLDGSNDSVSAPASYIPNTTAFTVCFWYKPQNTIDVNDRIVDQADAGPVNGFSFLHGTAAKPQVSFIIYGAAGAVANIASTDMKLGEWNFVIGEYAVNSVKLYINDAQNGSTDTSATMTTPAAQMHIGQRATGATNFAKGYVRDFRFYPRVLTSTERTNIYNGISVTGADIHYKLDDLSGSTATDSSGNSRNGTINGSALFSTEPDRRFLPSLSSKALNFAKLTTAKVTVSDTAALRIETNATFTWSSWIYLFNNRENVLPRIAEKGPHFWCFMGDQTNNKANYLALEIADAADATTEFWGNTQLQPGRWYHVATTFNAGTCVHYINGEKDITTILLGPYNGMKTTSGSNLIIGNTSGNSRNFSGMMRNFQQFNRTLTQAEVQQLYKGESVTSGLVGKWDFSEGTGTTAAGTGGDGTITAATWVNQTDTRTTATSRSAASTRTAA